MKTTNNVQKTENKQIKKTISKTLAIVLSLVLISFTVSAQGFWKQTLVNNTYGKMAELMVEQKNADDQHLNANAHSSETTTILPTINAETAKETTFENYFGSQWSTPNWMKTPTPMIDWRLNKSSSNN
jgi:hypothetical protein